MNDHDGDDHDGDNDDDDDEWMKGIDDNDHDDDDAAKVNSFQNCYNVSDQNIYIYDRLLISPSIPIYLKVGFFSCFAITLYDKKILANSWNVSNSP